MYPPSISETLDLVDTLITGPVAPAVDFDLARLHLAALTANDDVLIDGWVTAATQYIEEQTGRQMITATREVLLDRFPGSVLGAQVPVPASGINTGWSRRFRIELPRPPLQSVVSVQYVDGDGVVQDVLDPAGGSPPAAGYQVKNAIQTTPTDPHHRRGWIEPLAGAAWPQTTDEGGAVRIRYVAGYGDSAADVPDLLKTAILFLVGNFDQHRSADLSRSGFPDLPMNVASILLAFERTARSTWALR